MIDSSRKLIVIAAAILLTGIVRIMLLYGLGILGVIPTAPLGSNFVEALLKAIVVLPVAYAFFGNRWYRALFAACGVGVVSAVFLGIQAARYEFSSGLTFAILIAFLTWAICGFAAVWLADVLVLPKQRAVVGKSR